MHHFLPPVLLQLFSQACYTSSAILRGVECFIAFVQINLRFVNETEEVWQFFNFCFPVFASLNIFVFFRYLFMRLVSAYIDFNFFLLNLTVHEFVFGG